MSDIDDIFLALERQQSVLSDLEKRLEEEATADKEKSLREKQEQDDEDERHGIVLFIYLTFLLHYFCIFVSLYFVMVFEVF